MCKIRVLVVDDDSEFNRVLSHELGKAGLEVKSLTSGAKLIQHLRETPCNVILLDIQMPGKNGMQLLSEITKEFPGIQVIMLTGFGTIDSAVKAVRVGAFDYLTKPCDLSRIETSIRKAYRMSRLEQQNVMLKLSLAGTEIYSDLVGESQPIHDLKDFIARVAGTNSSVLLLGESGVGKEVVARAIHRASDRQNQPFVVVDCGALSENLLASELFGHEKGAYTGAINMKHGLFEVADGGTIFLDEIGELNPTIQVKLLRVLETSQFRRLGGNRDITVDVRVISSTNRNIQKEMTAGNFREDLYYRLNVIVTTIPPLRERDGDIPLLINHFLAKLRDASGRYKSVSPDSLKYLRAYSWPGNVRELRNILERLVILSPGEQILLEDLPKEILGESDSDYDHASQSIKTLKEIEMNYIQRVLQLTGGNRKQTAETLGIDPKTLYRKLKD